jgi:hypothetical protein
MQLMLEPGWTTYILHFKENGWLDTEIKDGGIRTKENNDNSNNTLGP